MSIKIETFIRKLNNTELEDQSTNDAYIRVSKEIQNKVPKSFFSELNSKKCKIIIKHNQTSKQFPSNKWLRYQFYPSNKEFRIVSLTEIFQKFKPSAGDYITIEKRTQTNENSYHYEVSMKSYDKVSMKYDKKDDVFEILNLDDVLKINLLEKDIELNFEGNKYVSKISLALKKKKRSDSKQETDYYSILNLPIGFTNKLSKSSFVEIVKKGGNLHLSIEKSWNYDIITRDNE